MTEELSFHIFTVGWEPSFIKLLGVPVADATGIRFTHGVVGDSRRVPSIKSMFPGTEILPLSKAKNEPLPKPDYGLLAGLECDGVPTIRSMVLGDRVLRDRPDSIALGYATLLAVNIRKMLLEMRPSIVLASFDNLHSSLSLAVARSLGIPWAAMSFGQIPPDLTGFCKGVIPNQLVPITRPIDSAMREEAESVLLDFKKNRSGKVVAIRPPRSAQQKMEGYRRHAKNFANRLFSSKELGWDPYLWTSNLERMREIGHKAINGLRLPRDRMLREPPTARFAFFPLHMLPESTVDTWAPFYQDQLALIRQLSHAIPIDMELVVKLHFSDPNHYSRNEILALMKLPRVRIADPDASSHSFIENSSLVLGIQGTACLEAGLLGKTVLMFGDSPYLEFPRTEKIDDISSLHSQIVRMLAAPEATESEIVEAFSTYMSRYMHGRSNDWSRPIEAEELTRLAKCFLELQVFVSDPANVSSWYS